ncbi:hypothetical protein HCH17_06730 [Klebsiella aerogenes]|uniref:hypothetical protein n=1 Tax=Klebsiella aerogenes TaxID=548 RepID=UPI001DFC96A0|nr:hypothetical protein [Klebsiella aerogenes]
MSDIYFPHDYLPMPLQEGYGFQPVSPLKRTQLTTGRARQRRAYTSTPTEATVNDPSIEPPRLVFCSSTRSVYDAIFEEIAPQADGTCQVTTRQYSDIFYQYDDANYPGSVS